MCLFFQVNEAHTVVKVCLFTKSVCLSHLISSPSLLSLLSLSFSVVSVLCVLFQVGQRSAVVKVCMLNLLLLLCLENVMIIYLFSIFASVFSVVPLFFCCLCAMCSFSGQRSALVKVRSLNLLIIVSSLLSLTAFIGMKVF